MTQNPLQKDYDYLQRKLVQMESVRDAQHSENQRYKQLLERILQDATEHNGKAFICPGILNDIERTVHS